MSWLAATFLGLSIRSWLLIAAAIALVAAIAIHVADNAVEDAIGAAEESGRAKAVAAGHEITLNQLGAANAAGNPVRNDVGTARYCECLLSATADTAGNCQRYLPDELVPGGPGNPGPRCPGGGRQ